MKRNKSLKGIVCSILALALASLACGVSDLSNPFATDTPTPTLTFTSTPTATPSATPTLTPTLTPTSTPLPTGVTVEPQADGTNLFIDYDNKYQLLLSADWVVIPVEKEDLNAMLEELAEDNPQFAEAAEAFKNLDPNVVRALALNKDPELFANGSTPNINITALDNPALALMPLSFITGALEESFNQQGIKVLTTGVNTIDNPNGVDIEYMDIEQNLNGFTVQQRLIVFQNNEKLIMITVSTIPQFKEAVFEMAEEIAASIEVSK